MTNAVADCMIHGHEELIERLQLPDPDDRHVLAAAIRSGAQGIVTFNLRDFPAASLAPYEVEAIHPDEFVVDLLDLSPSAVTSVVREQVEALKNPPCTLAQVLGALEENGLVQSVAKLRELLDEESKLL